MQATLRSELNRNYSEQPGRRTGIGNLSSRTAYLRLNSWPAFGYGSAAFAGFCDPMPSRRFLPRFVRDLFQRPIAALSMAQRRSAATVGGTPAGIVRTSVGRIHFDVDMALHRNARSYFYRVHDMALERVFRRHLDHGGIFIDVGSQMGYWSALAASRVGPSGQVHAFEPAPAFYASLRRLVAANPTFYIKIQNAALGAEPGVLPLTVLLPKSPEEGQVVGASLVPDYFVDDPRPKAVVDVHVGTFDDYADWALLDPDRIGLVRIDVDGFEASVLSGMMSIIDRPRRRTAILATVHTDVARHPLLDGGALLSRMENFGYVPLDAHTLKRVKAQSLRPVQIVLFIPT